MHQKKVGLCIVHRNNNYGGILQSYATLIKMEELGLDYEIIDYKHPKNVGFYVKAFSSVANKVTVYSKLRSLRKRIGKKLHQEYASNSAIRDRKFDEFSREKFVRFSKPIRDYNELQDYAKKYTDIIVGSDQMWLPSGLGTNFYNLMFAPEACNKIAYASSFGVSHIPINQVDKTKKYLNRIQHISVRETSGQKIVKEITGRDVPVILDPTMIITQKQWDENIPDNRFIDEDYIFCYFLGNNPTQRAEVLKLKNNTGLKIVALKHIDEYISTDESFGDIAPYDVGPSEFVNLIRHARYVCTDSFHGSVFSIIYHKQFISFNRFTEGFNSRNSRLDTLFQSIGVSRRFRNDIVKEMVEPIDYEKVESALNNLRSFAHNYLVDALGLDNSDIKSMNYDGQKVKGYVICVESDCTGCSACSSVCPQNAISMVLDERGFWRPHVDECICINCNSCNQVCPVNHAPKTYGPTKVFAYQNLNNIVRFNSTSGGFFNAIATNTIIDGGIVCGAAFDEKMHLCHTFVEKVEGLVPFQKSKYVQSSLAGVLRKIQEYLKEGRKTLFVGMGCQAAALRNYIGQDDNLIIIDLVCYGIPSTGLFDDWIIYLEQKYGKVKDVRFRDKSYGYATPNVKVLFENDKYIETCRDSNMYTDLFFRHLSIRDCCYSCHFKTVDRTSDITLGDFWTGYKFNDKFDDNLGSTLVFAHTVKGFGICQEMCQMELELESVLNTDATKMTECIIPASNVQSFWMKYQEDGFERTVELYEQDNIKVRIKYLIKTMMNKTGVSERWYKRQKRKRLNTD